MLKKNFAHNSVRFRRMSPLNVDDSVRNALLFLLVILGAISAGVPARTDENKALIQLVGTVRLDGSIADQSGLSAKLEDGSRSDLFGGLSAIDYMGTDQSFLLLSDRGAGDGAVSFPCRFHEVRLTLQDIGGDIDFELLGTTLLTTPTGASLVGSLTAHAEDQARAASSDKTTPWTAFDPEGLRRLSDGTLVVTDEYGPRVVVFDESGRLLNKFNTPKKFDLLATVDGKYERGTFPNRGLEGIAVTPSGQRFVAVIQSPLVQDGKIKGDKCQGLNCRWIVFDGSRNCEREVVYQLDSLKTGVSEVLAVSETTFLVLERDSDAGQDAKIKRVYFADIASASDATNIDSLPQENLPKDFVPVSKRLLIDLLDDRFGIGGKRAAEKPEGLSWGPPLADGRRTLWLCCDNDFDPKVKSEIYCFAVPDSAF